uniref:Uncharacterized protein n=1 Tax=Mustela putorius furo TaxID=9669 RepID=M3XMH3_MUSPF
FNLAYDSWDFCYIRQVLPCAFHPPDVTWAPNLLEPNPQCSPLCALYPLAVLSSPTPGSTAWTASFGNTLPVQAVHPPCDVHKRN